MSCARLSPRILRGPFGAEWQSLSTSLERRCTSTRCQHRTHEWKRKPNGERHRCSGKPQGSRSSGVPPRLSGNERIDKKAESAETIRSCGNLGESVRDDRTRSWFVYRAGPLPTHVAPEQAQLIRWLQGQFRGDRSCNVEHEA